jgi:glycosyltransferase involved in cell wall biosynthesis
MSNSLVSVIIPVYNAERYLAATLASVFNQTYSDYEVICVDDGSTDGSMSVLERYGNRLKIVQQPNSGPSVARNTGAWHAQGRYLSFLDADDLWYRRKLELQVYALETRADAVLVHSDYDVINEKGELLQRGAGQSARTATQDDWVSQLLGPQAWILPSLITVRRDAFERIGGFDTELRFDEEADLCLRIRTQGEVLFINEAGVAYRQHAASRSKQGDRADVQLAAGVNFYCKLERHFVDDPKKLRLVRLILASKFSDWGWHKIRSGERQEGSRLLMNAISYDPFRFRTYSRLLRALLRPSTS